MASSRTTLEGAPTFPLWHRVFRLVWSISWFVLCRWTPPFMWRWRCAVLRLFGAKIGKPCDVRGTCKVWYPPNLTLADHSMIADRVNVYNVAPISLGSWTIVSQDAELCTASHDISVRGFPLTRASIVIGDYCWVAAHAFVCPGVTLADGTVLGARALAAKDTESWKVYVGNPAKAVKERDPAAVNMDLDPDT